MRLRVAAARIKAIPTKYKGVTFRSRTEARWAVCFDKMKVRWRWENQGYDLGDFDPYLPDFVLPDFDIIAEIKGAPFTIEERRKCKELCAGLSKPVLMLPDVPAVQLYEIYVPSKSGPIVEEWDWSTGDGAEYERAIEAALSERFERRKK